MSIVASRNATGSFDDVQGLTEALAGAFAEGVDLGPRGPQIRVLGHSLETMVEALRVELARLGVREDVNGGPPNLDSIIRLAQAARSYGISEAE